MTPHASPDEALRRLTVAKVPRADALACAELLGDLKLLRGWIDSFEAQVGARLRDLHASGEAPAADLHTACGGVSAAEGKRKERRSKTIEEAPSFGEALAVGDVGAEHVDALANATSKLDEDVKAALLDCEHDLLADATRMTPEQFGRSCRDLARRLERDQGIDRNTRQRQADVTLIVDDRTASTGELHEHGVCETDGAALPPASVRRLLCNGRVTPVVVDQSGKPFDMGRTIRHANRRQRRALRAIYRCCAFAGCDVAFDRCEIHHLLPWELGGPTDLANLLPLCSRHHHVVHEGGWELELADDRTLTIRQSDGNVFAVTRPDIVEQRLRRRAAA